jgi:formyltetrahydrofolate-dependent phosphoribosylglycinamide formyltransferase
VTARIVVLASGTGTLFEALLDSGLRTSVVGLVTDQPGARAVDVAESHGIPVRRIPLIDFDSRDLWQSELLRQVKELNPDLIVAAGFMRILSPVFVNQFPDQIVNSHPSLLPQFPGAHAVRDAIDSGATVTGCTVHFIDEGVDTGKIIAQEQVDVLPGESEAQLHERIKTVERTLLPHSVERLLIERFGKGFQ